MRHKFIAFSTALAVCLGFGTSLTAGAVSLGDIDGSGSINSADASMVLEDYSISSTKGISKLSNIQKQAADVNRDGVINSSDASDILSYYSYISTGGDMLIDYYLKDKKTNPQDSYISEDEKLYSLALDMGRAVNRERTALGLEPMKVTPYLMDIAFTRANETVEIFSHYRPDGSDCFSILDDTKVPYYHAGEDIAAGASTVSGTLENWRNSTMGHWDEIIRKNNTHMGIGVAYDENSTYGWYWEIFFVEAARPLDGEYIP